MPLTNKFAGKCAACGGRVPEQTGTLVKAGGTWVVYHHEHVPGGGAAKVPASGGGGGQPPSGGAPRIAVTAFGGGALIKPKDYLGGDLFQRYRGATEVAGCRYDRGANGNVCGFEALLRLVETLQASGFVLEVSPDVTAAMQARSQQAKVDIGSAQGRLAEAEEKLKKRGLFLFPFQRIGVEWLAARDRGMLADQMGLGKTMQTFSFGHALAERLAATGELTEKQWAAAIRMLAKYHRQIGKKPSKEVVES